MNRFDIIGSVRLLVESHHFFCRDLDPSWFE